MYVSNRLWAAFWVTVGIGILSSVACGTYTGGPCRQRKDIVYSRDQMKALVGGCPLGVAPSGHPHTVDTPCVSESGLPTDECGS